MTLRHEDRRSLADFLTDYKAIIGVVVALLGAGFFVNAYLNRYALAVELEAVRTQVQAHTEQLGEIQQMMKALRESQDWQHDQLWQIARTVGAPSPPARKVTHE